MAERKRYTDEELEEFRVLINEKLDAAQKEYDHLKDMLMAHAQDASDTTHTFKFMEDGQDVSQKEELGRLADRQYKYIQNLKNALIRIENKTYGICRVTGKLIPKERLRLVPHATLSMEAKNMKDRK